MHAILSMNFAWKLKDEYENWKLRECKNEKKILCFFLGRGKVDVGFVLMVVHSKWKL